MGPDKATTWALRTSASGDGVLQHLPLSALIRIHQHPINFYCACALLLLFPQSRSEHHRPAFLAIVPVNAPLFTHGAPPLPAGLITNLPSTLLLFPKTLYSHIWSPHIQSPVSLFVFGVRNSVQIHHL